MLPNFLPDFGVPGWLSLRKKIRVLLAVKYLLCFLLEQPLFEKLQAVVAAYMRPGQKES